MALLLWAEVFSLSIAAMASANEGSPISVPAIFVALCITFIWDHHKFPVN